VAGYLGELSIPQQTGDSAGADDAVLQAARTLQQVNRPDEFIWPVGWQFELY